MLHLRASVAAERPAGPAPMTIKSKSSLFIAAAFFRWLKQSRAILLSYYHAVLDSYLAGLAIRHTINFHEAIEADPHHAKCCTRIAFDRTVSKRSAAIDKQSCGNICTKWYAKLPVIKIEDYPLPGCIVLDFE